MPGGKEVGANIEELHAVNGKPGHPDRDNDQIVAIAESESRRAKGEPDYVPKGHKTDKHGLARMTKRG